MANVASSVYELELLDGRNVLLTLNYARLYALRAKNKKLYENFNKAKNNLDKNDEFDVLCVIFTAYRCANPDAEESFEEFIGLVPPDSNVVYTLLMDLISPSKKKEVL